ncbi:MAG: AraC family transcriptional regulator [Flavobacterium sp.]|nr:MAG: AraC family transcriptional regulator [Flavobacterium sp.]
MRLPVPDKKKLQLIAEKLDTDFSSNYSIADLADMANMSASRFKTGFRILFGMPVHQFIVHKKMAYAQHMILQDELTLAQIAKRCGYKYTIIRVIRFDSCHE